MAHKPQCSLMHFSLSCQSFSVYSPFLFMHVSFRIHRFTYPNTVNHVRSVHTRDDSERCSESGCTEKESSRAKSKCRRVCMCFGLVLCRNTREHDFAEACRRWTFGGSEMCAMCGRWHILKAITASRATNARQRWTTTMAPQVNFHKRRCIACVCACDDSTEQSLSTVFSYYYFRWTHALSAFNVHTAHFIIAHPRCAMQTVFPAECVCVLYTHDNT